MAAEDPRRGPWAFHNYATRGTLFGGALIFALLNSTAAAAEARSYVVSWFTNAAYSQDGDCPKGINPGGAEQYRKNLLELGMPTAEVDALITEHLNSANGGRVNDLIRNRGRIDGKPVNAFQNPASVVDPNLHTVEGRFAHGFDLDGKGAGTPRSFEDPDTHEKGVDNQMFRAIGCIGNFRGPPSSPTRPMYMAYNWDSLRNSFPAWLVTIVADDFRNDDTATIIFDRSLDHADTDVRGETQADTTFRIDPDPRSHHEFPASIKNGVLSLNVQPNLHLVGDPILVAQLNLYRMKVRFTIKNDGLIGIIGGYQPWKEVYFPFGQGGTNIESNFAMDLAGIYHVLRRLADADPDPQTGENTKISAVYTVEAVPAFVVSTEPSLQSARSQ